MASSMTYSQLVEDVKTYAERSDSPFIDQIPRFIMLAENRIASEVRGLGFTRFVTTNLVQGQATLAKPARWRETLGVYMAVSGESKLLKQRTYGYCREYSPVGSFAAEPVYYADYDYEHYLISPTPDDDYVVEIQYHERPVPLDATNQTNWTTQYAPQLLLYATLLEAQPWLKLGARTAEFQALYDRAAAAVTAEAQRRIAGDQNMMRTTG